MAKVGLLERLLDTSDEEDNDFFDSETALFSSDEANKPILDFSDSDSDDETPQRSTSLYQGPVETSLNSILSSERTLPK